MVQFVPIQDSENQSVMKVIKTVIQNLIHIMLVFVQLTQLLHKSFFGGKWPGANIPPTPTPPPHTHTKVKWHNEFNFWGNMFLLRQSFSKSMEVSPYLVSGLYEQQIGPAWLLSSSSSMHRSIHYITGGHLGNTEWNTTQYTTFELEEMLSIG